MTHDAPDTTDATLDRLVDGELSNDERRQVLAALDAQCDGWRRCALAFLEAQTWRSELRRIVRPAASEAEAPLVTRPIESPADDPRNTRGGPAAPTSSPPRSRSLRQWFAVAASLLAAFTLGRQLQPAGAPSGGAPVAGVDQSKEQLAARPPVELPREAAVGDAVTLVVNDHAGRPQRIRVPLVEGHNLGGQFVDTPGWTEAPELTRQLHERGLGLSARRRYAPLYFEQQNQVIPMIVPVDDAVITPVSRPVF